MVLGLTHPSFAGMKIKEVIGTWIYEKGKPGVAGKVFTENGAVSNEERKVPISGEKIS